MRIFNRLDKVWIACLAGIMALASMQSAEAQDALPLGLPPLSIPADNPQTPQKIALGKTLFMDKRLSADGTISCANCHEPDRAFTDGRHLAQGFHQQLGTRNAPTIVNAAYFTSQFWDGRRASLEDQAKDPLINPLEHALADENSVLSIVRGDASYTASFNDVFAVSPDRITIDHVAKAIAAFERTLIFGDSPFDRYTYGGDKKALSESAIRGLELFRGRGQCQNCHTIGPGSALFSDNAFHSLGVGYKRIEPRLAELATRIAKTGTQAVGEAILSAPELSELGRFLVTLKPVDIGRFKTPALRNVAITAPYMHDGSIKTLEEAVNLEVYYRGIEAGRPLILTPREKADLVDFLQTLTSPKFSGHIGASGDSVGKAH